MRAVQHFSQRWRFCRLDEPDREEEEPYWRRSGAELRRSLLPFECYIAERGDES